MRGRHRISARPVCAVVATAAVLAVTACGTTSNTHSQSSSSCTTPGVSANQIKLGFLFPSSGLDASGFATMRGGLDARLGVANAAGGVDGRTISYTWQDDASNPGSNLSGARALVTQKVFGIIETTLESSGSAAYLHANGIPVTGVALDPAWATNNNMFTFSSFVGPGSVTTWGDYVAAQGGKTALILRQAFNAGTRYQVAWLSASLRAAGVQVAGSVEVASDAVNIPGIAAAIKNSGADSIVSLTPPVAFDQAISGLRAAGITLKAAMTYTPGYDPGLLKQYGRGIAGTSYFLDFAPFELKTAAHRAFLDAVAKYAPSLDPPTQGGAVAGWITADMMIRGLRAAGPCPTRKGFIAALRGITDYTAGGLLPAPLDLTTSFGQLNRCYWFVKVNSDGTRFIPEPAARCGERISLSQ
jgi:branched-chain amino acid transport system substrate-binding protein